MKKVVLMSLETAMLEWSPAKYQLLEELSARGFDTYLFLSGRLRNKAGYRSIGHVVNTKYMSDRDIRKKIISIEPHAVIATLYVDTSVIYQLPYTMKNTSFYYYNLEIYTPYVDRYTRKKNFQACMEYKSRYPACKIKEMLYTRKARAFSIQDKLRMRLSKKYHINYPDPIFIPNSYIFDETKVIPPGRRGVVYTGGIKYGFLAEKFKDLANVKKTPVTFSGQIDPWCRREMNRIMASNLNIRLEEQVLPIGEYTGYLQQFAVGLVWYSPLREDEAHYYMGLSSGKMFKHLSLGQPVIATKCRGPAEAVEKYKLGIVIDSISELDDAYDEIMNNYAYYRENVIRTYKRKFDFKKLIAPFIDAIDKFSAEN